MKGPFLAIAAALVGGIAAIGAASIAPSARAAPSEQGSSHVVVVGISGLRWSDVSAAQSPAFYGLARQGSIGTLVEHAVLPLTCPADAWLTLNGGARAQQVQHRESGPCPAMAQAGSSGTIASMPGIVAYNKTLSYNPVWGALSGGASRAGTAGGCSLAVGPGAALALAKPDGQVDRYLASPADLS